MPEAPKVDDAIYPDEYIEYWGQRFVEGGFAYLGVTLMQFLARPLRYVDDPRTHRCCRASAACSTA